MFQFSGSPPAWLCIRHAVTEVCSAAFPHSDIRGSLLICSSPRLFAAYHVFLRLLVPRHPSRALSGLTFVVPASLPIQGTQQKLKSRFLPEHTSVCALQALFDNPHCLSSHSRGLDVSAHISLIVDICRVYSHTHFLVQCSVVKVLKSPPGDSVEMERFELLTPCLQGRCSPN